jgi:O-antigen ligase
MLFRGWLRDPETTASQKALYAAAALTFFCLSLGTAPSTIAGALAAGIWLFSGIALQRRRIYAATYWWPVFALFILYWMGMIYTHDTTGIGLEYAEKTYYWLFGLSVAAISFQRFNPTRLVQAFMLGLGINVFAAIAQIVFQLPDKNNQHRGLGPDYSTLSAYLIVGIMMAVFFLNRERRAKLRMALVGLIGLYFFHFVILQSRASYVAFVLLAPFIGYTFFKRKKLLKTAGVCVLIPCLMMLSPIVRDRMATTVDQFNHHFYATDDSAWGNKYFAHEERLYLWNGALRIIKQNPWVGVGTGGYQTALNKLDSDPNVPLMAHPHNDFLYMAASFGIVGVAVFSWFLVVGLSNGWRRRKTAEGYFVLCVFLVMVATGLFNTQMLDVGTAFLISLAIGLQASFVRRNTNG